MCEKIDTCTNACVKPVQNGKMEVFGIWVSDKNTYDLTA